MAELVTDYMEGELSWQQRLSARLHLFLCSACTHYFDQMHRTIGLLRQRPLQPLRMAEETALLQRIRPAPPSG